jgi:hypothetical protein
MKKNGHFFIGIIVVWAVIVFGFAGCDNGISGGEGGNTDGGNTSEVGDTIGPLSAEELSAALADLPANTAAAPHIVKLDSSVTIDNADSSSTSIWASINSTVKSAGKFVILDLGDCSVKGAMQGGKIISSNQYIKGIALPNSLTSIGNSAFANCTHLTKVTIPGSVTSIGNSAFEDCPGITGVTIPAHLTAKFADKFSGYSNLALVITGTSDIPNDAFTTWAPARGCTGITSVTIGDGVTGIGQRAFSSCTGLTKVTIPGSITSIGDSAFAYCTGLTSITIPGSVTSIGNSAFRYCKGLTSVTIPESVTSIGAYGWSSSGNNGATTFGLTYGAFDECSGLKMVTIPARLTVRFAGIFSGYSNLALVLTGNGSVPNSAFRRYTNMLTAGAKSYCDKITSIIIENGVTGIGQAGFYECTGLSSVSIPSSVTSIGPYAFRDCSKLTSVTIPASVIGIAEGTFYECTGLTSVTISNSVAVIEELAFAGCTALTSITIPNSLNEWRQLGVEIGQIIPIVKDFAPSSDTVYIDGVSTIKTNAFAGCTGLVSVTFGGNAIFDHNKYEAEKFVNAIVMLAGLVLGEGFLSQISTIMDARGLVADVRNGSLNARYEIGFYDNAFQQGSSYNSVGNALKTAYLAGGKGTYTRTAGGSVWTRQ